MMIMMIAPMMMAKRPVLASAMSCSTVVFLFMPLLYTSNPDRPDRIQKILNCRKCLFHRHLHRIPECVHVVLDTVSRIHVAHPRERDHHVIPQAMRHAPRVDVGSGVEGQGINVARLHREIMREPIHALGVLISVGVRRMPLGQHLACNGASENSVAAAVGSSVRGRHYAPHYTARIQVVYPQNKKISSDVSA